MIKNTINAINPILVLQRPIDHIAKGVAKVVDLIGNKAKPFLNFMKNLASTADSAVGKAANALGLGVGLASIYVPNKHTFLCMNRVNMLFYYHIKFMRKLCFYLHSSGPLL